MESLDARTQLEEILSQDSVEIAVRNGKTLISTVDLLSVLAVEGWFIDPAGYVRRAMSTAWGNNLYLHSLIANDKNVDHANGNKLDNRRENLRLCTQSQNMANQKVPADSSTGYKGVHRTPAGTFYVAVMKDGVPHRLGTFPDVESAARAYDDKSVELFGEYAATNFPREGHRWAREHLADDVESVAPRG